MDLPDPVEPIKAIVSPALASNEMSERTFSAALGYENETCLKINDGTRFGVPIVSFFQRI